jgi:long-chain acyl-CoA synthetase
MFDGSTVRVSSVRESMHNEIGLLMFTVRADGHPASAELLDRLDSLAPGSRVLIKASSSLEFINLVTFCWDRRITVTPVDPAARPELVAALTKHLEPRLVIANGSATHLPTDLVTPSGVQLIVYTSGSTGDPKGVMLSRDAVELNASATAELHNFQPGTCHATCLPLHHCNALIMSVIGSYISGSSLYVQIPFNPRTFIRGIGEVSARTASITPALLQRLVDARPQWPDSLGYFVTAAAPLSRSLSRQFSELYGPRLRQGYGMTEASNFSFLMPLLDAESFSREYIEDIPPVGLPLAGTELRMRGRTIELRSLHAMDGYWRVSHDAQNVVTEDGWIRTGDLGYMRGPYLVLTGRSKETINRGGETIYPLEVEEAWSAAGIRPPFAAAAVPTRVGDEIGLWLEGDDFASVNALFNEGNIFRPAVVQFGDLPRTSTGKPRRTAMTGSGFAPCVESPERYEELLGHALMTARQISRDVDCPRNTVARYIYTEAVRLTNALRHWPEAQDTDPALRSDIPACRILDLLGHAWGDLRLGRVDGSFLIKSVPEVWMRLMREWPMASYAEMMASHLKASCHLTGRVLELGAGVGNTSRLLAEHLGDGDGYVRSDIDPSLCRRLDLPGAVVRCDFDDPLPFERLDLIFSVNALHCSRDSLITMRHIANALKPGGSVVIAEGNGPTTDGVTPWALNALFGILEGWWVRGGFRDRWQWLQSFHDVGLVRCGFSQLRAGRHDLGGLIWGQKPGY